MTSKYTNEAEEFKALRRRLNRAAKTPVPDGLVEQIRSAFADMEIPPEDILVNCPCDEHQATRRRFAGKHWTQITDPLFFHRNAYWLSLLEAEAFRFYLPAFLLGDLLKLGAELGEKRNTMDYSFHLTPFHKEPVQGSPNQAEFDAYWLNHLSGFTPQQKDVIRAYLRFCFTREPAVEQEEAIRQQRILDFWDTFEG